MASNNVGVNPPIVPNPQPTGLITAPDSPTLNDGSSSFVLVAYIPQPTTNPPQIPVIVLSGSTITITISYPKNSNLTGTPSYTIFSYNIDLSSYPIEYYTLVLEYDSTVPLPPNAPNPSNRQTTVVSVRIGMP